MIELAEDEQQAFIEKMKQKALRLKRPAEHPVFIAMVGTQGAGKSTIARQEKNAVLLASDQIIMEYAKWMNIDISGAFYDKELGLFASRVNNEIYKEAVRRRLNIIYDTSVLSNTRKMLEHAPNFGYTTKVKAVLVDEYQGAMNVVERKMKIDDQYRRYSRERPHARYPKGNPFPVSPEQSMISSMAVVEFIEEAMQKGIPLEIYEFGKKEPSFRTGEDFESFIDSLQPVSMAEHLKRCESLARKADDRGREDDFLNLMALKQEMMERK